MLKSDMKKYIFRATGCIVLELAYNLSSALQILHSMRSKGEGAKDRLTDISGGNLLV